MWGDGRAGGCTHMLCGTRSAGLDVDSRLLTVATIKSDVDTMVLHVGTMRRPLEVRVGEDSVHFSDSWPATQCAQPLHGGRSTCACAWQAAKQGAPHAHTHAHALTQAHAASVHGRTAGSPPSPPSTPPFYPPPHTHSPRPTRDDEGQVGAGPCLARPPPMAPLMEDWVGWGR